MDSCGEGVSASALARLLGVDRGQVTRWIAEGMPTLEAAAEGGAGHRIDVGAALRWRVERVEADAERRVAAAIAEVHGDAEGGLRSKEEAERRAAWAGAHIREIDLAERRGEVVPREEVRATVAAQYAQVAQALTGAVSTHGTAVQRDVLGALRLLRLEAVPGCGEDAEGGAS